VNKSRKRFLHNRRVTAVFFNKFLDNFSAKMATANFIKIKVNKYKFTKLLSFRFFFCLLLNHDFCLIFNGPCRILLRRNKINDIPGAQKKLVALSGDNGVFEREVLTRFFFGFFLGKMRLVLCIKIYFYNTFRT
jgi:hypothetical protein